MNNSSSMRVIGLALGLTVAGGVLLLIGNKVFWSPYSAALKQRTLLESQVDEKDKEWRKYQQDKDSVKKWNKLSLSNDPALAAAEYGKMLKPLLRESGLVVDDFQGPPPPEPATASAQKKAKHVILPFQVRAKGTIESLAKALETLQRTPVMHRVKSMTIDRLDTKDRAGKVNVQMVIEAVIVTGAMNRPKLGSAEYLLESITNRSYTDIAKRNPFVGPIPAEPPPKPPEPEPEPPSGPDMREFIRIDTIVPTSQEAFLRNTLYKSSPIRLRSNPMSGYDTFRIRDEAERVLVRGKVLRIDERDIYFQVASEVYAFHFGESLADAMQKPLSPSQLRSLDLASLVDAQFAKEAKDAKDKEVKETRDSRAPREPRETRESTRDNSKTRSPSETPFQTPTQKKGPSRRPTRRTLRQWLFD